MSTWLVTGGSGFVGRHLLDALVAAAPAGARVVALGRNRPPGIPEDQFLAADLTDFESLRQTLRAADPEVVYHLAGQLPPAPAASLFQVNTQGTVHLLRALGSANRPVRVVVAGSAAELGPVPESCLPVDEACPCRPEGAYALSKWFATAYACRSRAPLSVSVARLFNPIGPGMPASLAFGRFAQTLARTESTPVRLLVGDLDVRRDVVDVRDVARALIALAERGRAGLVYHVGSGRSLRIGDGLDQLVRLSGRPVEMTTRSSPRRGPADSRAAIHRIREHTGWEPQIEWRRSLADLWNEAVQERQPRRVA